MDLLRILGNYSDIEQEIYLAQLEKLDKGVIIETIYDLSLNASELFNLDHLFFYSQFSIRGEIYDSNRFLFEDDKIEVTHLAPNRYKIRLIEKGWSRVQTEKKSYIFNTDDFARIFWKNTILNELLNLDILSVSYALKKSVFDSWWLINDSNRDFLLAVEFLNSSSEISYYDRMNHKLREVMHLYVSNRKSHPPIDIGDAVFYILGFKAIYNKKAIDKKLEEKLEFWERPEVILID